MKKKKAFTIGELLFSSGIFSMLAVMGLSVITMITWTLYTGQTEGTNRTTFNEIMYFITREVQSAEAVKISGEGKCLEIKERGRFDYNLKYSIVESYPTDYLAFEDKRLIDVEADESGFSFDEETIRLKLATVKNSVEANQKDNIFEISILPRSTCRKETE